VWAGRGAVVVTCKAATFGNAQWPEFAPYGVTQPVSGTCVLGFIATDPDDPPTRNCTVEGTSANYALEITNPCIRMTLRGQGGTPPTVPVRTRLTVVPAAAVTPARAHRQQVR